MGVERERGRESYNHAWVMGCSPLASLSLSLLRLLFWSEPPAASPRQPAEGPRLRVGPASARWARRPGGTMAARGHGIQGQLRARRTRARRATFRRASAGGRGSARRHPGRRRERPGPGSADSRRLGGAFAQKSAGRGMVGTLT